MEELGKPPYLGAIQKHLHLSWRGLEKARKRDSESLSVVCTIPLAAIVLLSGTRKSQILPSSLKKKKNPASSGAFQEQRPCLFRRLSPPHSLVLQNGLPCTSLAGKLCQKPRCQVLSPLHTGDRCSSCPCTRLTPHLHGPKGFQTPQHPTPPGPHFPPVSPLRWLEGGSSRSLLRVGSRCCWEQLEAGLGSSRPPARLSLWSLFSLLVSAGTSGQQSGLCTRSCGPATPPPSSPPGPAQAGNSAPSWRAGQRSWPATTSGARGSTESSGSVSASGTSPFGSSCSSTQDWERWPERQTLTWEFEAAP